VAADPLGNGRAGRDLSSYFAPVPMQYLAGVFPTYWPMRALWSAARKLECPSA
jgi:hypothetical protein